MVKTTYLCSIILFNFFTKYLKLIYFQIKAVAARDLEKAKEFAALHLVERSYGCYEELSADSEVGQLLLDQYSTFQSSLKIFGNFYVALK